MTQLEPTIRRATLDDAETLATFNCQLALETESKTLDFATVQRGVRRGIQVGEEVVYYVAELDSDIVGAVMLTREWSDWRDGWAYWLQSVYVRAELRGQGLFRELLRHVIDTLEQKPDVIGLRLYVESKNSSARAVYAKSGFVESGYRILLRPVSSR